MSGHALEIEEDAGVIDETCFEVALDIAYGADFEPRFVQREHGFEPAGKEFQVIVKKQKVFALGPLGGAIVGFAKSEVFGISESEAGIG